MIGSIFEIGSVLLGMIILFFIYTIEIRTIGRLHTAHKYFFLAFVLMEANLVMELLDYYYLLPINSLITSRLFFQIFKLSIFIVLAIGFWNLMDCIKIAANDPHLKKVKRKK